MKNKMIMSVFALLIVGLVGLGLVTAHGVSNENYLTNGEDESDFDMHNEVSELIESGSYDELEKLREEYNMPVMHWVNSEEDFEFAKEMHERFSNDNYIGGRKGMPCHGEY